MCGRFAYYSAHEAMSGMFGVEAAPGVEASYNIAPTQNAAVLRAGADGRRTVSMLRWGLVPFWAKDLAIGNKLINARAETVAEKPSFRAAYRKRRCLVPADGYYEWRAGEAGKQPYFISARDGEAMLIAGLWERWDKSGDPVETFTLLTRAPNDFAARIHHRMPVLVPRAEMDGWLDGELGAGPADERVSDTPEDYLQAWPVAKTVNSPRNNDPSLIEPIELAG